MSTLRDKVFNTPDDFKSETVDVPEWETKIVVRELSVADRGALVIDDMGRENGDPIAPARVVIACAYDEDGNKVFTEDGDAERLGARAASVVDRLAAVGRRLSGMDGTLADKVDEAGKDSSTTESSSPESV